jgi:DNA-3-methyladenine glycosylase II
MAPSTLDLPRLHAAAAVLADRDADLAGILARHGPPPLWNRPPGFATLAAIVLEQQVSLASGAAALERLRIAAGSLEPAAIAAIGEPDEAAREHLTALLGVGRWTADIYLLMALGRPDIWPDGDLALAAAMRRAKGLATVPDVVTQRKVAETWRPWRAVGARLLWHAYLAGER